MKIEAIIKHIPGALEVYAEVEGYLRGKFEEIMGTHDPKEQHA